MKDLYCDKCKNYTKHAPADGATSTGNDLMVCSICNAIYEESRKRYVITGPPDKKEYRKAKAALLEQDPTAIIINEDVAIKHKMKNWRTRPLDYDKKIPRNESCPCGSGIKYKKCCLKHKTE
jgi:preprotein translocase subunit SecA